MPSKIYLIVYRSRLFPAHWSLWIPSDRISRHNIAFGKIIHVTGDSRAGFVHEFKRNYELAGTGRAYDMFLLGSTSESSNVVVVDVVGNEEFSTDDVANDIIEQYALAVPAPGKSLRSTSNEVCRLLLSVILWCLIVTVYLYSQSKLRFPSRIVRPGCASSWRNSWKRKFY
jgi:hypothetical protein